MSNENNEILLLEASLQGDKAAFERIVSKYQGFICAVTYSAVGDVEKSEELAHETFISAWRSLGQLKDLGKFQGWIGTIARNVVRNSFRDKKRDIVSRAADIDSVDESAVAADESDEQALTDQRKEVAEQALKRIPEKYREVIVLYYRQEQSVKDVAAQIELSEAAVKQRLSRGRKMLKEQAAEMIETTISRTGPGKAFTACVMATVSAMALKGAAAAGAVSAVAAAGGKSGVLSVAFSTAAAKIITAAAVAVIAVGGAVMYKNFKSPPVQKDKPLQVADASQDSELDDAVENSNDEYIASLQPEVSIVEPVETVSNEVAADTTVNPLEKAPRYIDPNTLTDIYFKSTEFREGSVWSMKESWIKRPYCWRINNWNNKTIINNGKIRQELDHKNLTAELSESSNAKAEIPEYPESEMLFGFIQIGRNLITGKDVRYGHKFFKEEHGYKIDPPSSGKKTPDELMKYSVNILEGDGHGVLYVYVDSKTGLLQRMFMEVESEENIEHEYLFDYSEIDPSIFSLTTPEGYKEHAKRLSPKFQGWIFDEDLKPVANAEIFLLGENDRGVKGTSNSEGEYNFYIPVGNQGEEDALEYPVFVRAISKDHPGQVAWTVIQVPDSDFELKAVIPSPGEIRREAKGKGTWAKCLAVHNVTLMLEPGASISGQVLDRVTGKPVANAMVGLRASIRGKSRNLFDSIAGDGRRGDYEVKTDENGFYVFTSLPTFAWPEDTIEEAYKAYMSDRQQQYRTYVSVRVERDGYLLNGSEVAMLTPKDFLEDKQVDFALIPANVTVRGRVTDDDGKPVAGYQVEYCSNIYGGDIHCGGEYIRTNENGEYEITGCAYHETLSIRVETGRKPNKWDEEDATKDKEFIYYGYKYVPVEIEDGVNEYEVDIVLEKPKSVVVFDVKDTAGMPIEGMPLQIRYVGGILSDEWVEILKGTTDKDGKCVISGLPNMKDETLAFIVTPTYAIKPVDENGKLLQERLRQYDDFSSKIEDLPDGREGYVIEVTVPKKGEKLDSKKRVKAFDFEGKEIGQ